MSRKCIVFLASLLFFTSNCFGQSGWVSKFFNNTSGIGKIIARDSVNYLALSGYGRYFKSSDSGNNWVCIPEYSFDSSYALFDGQFINSQTGWIIGSGSQTNNGIILITTNGGLNWVKKTTGFNNHSCYCLNFLNANTGWIGTSGGYDGWLLKTTDGGNSWTKQVFAGKWNIRTVHFVDNNTGWILSDNMFTAQTTNGGLSWIPKTINNIPYTPTNYVSLFVISGNESWALVYSSNDGFSYSNFLKTTNSGSNWNLMYSYSDGLNTNSHNFWYLNFPASSIGYANGEFNYILKTTNTGVNWTNIVPSTTTGIIGNIGSLLPINNNELLVGGGYSYSNSPAFNYIFKSTDQGANWSVKTYNWDISFFKTYFMSAFTGFVLGDSGKVYKTTNAGDNWTLSLNNRQYYLRDLSFIDANTGCIVLQGRTSPYSGKIIRTTDEGSNWTELTLPFNLEMNTIKFTQDGTGWIGCDSLRILKSSSSGSNWTLLHLNNDKQMRIKSISFINNSTGWLLGNYYWAQYPYGSYEKDAIWKTINAGLNWNLIFDSVGSTSDFQITFLNSNVGYKLAYYGPIFEKTTNGGENWFNTIIPNLNCSNYCYVQCFGFVNQNTGWVAGVNREQDCTKLLKTTNGGISWVLQFSKYNNTIWSLSAIDSNSAWFSGNRSSIYSTTNGGGSIIGISPIPKLFTLSQNYPNPFNPQTKIKFDISKQSFAKLVIYDIIGREVATLVNEELKPGTYSFDWDGSNYASGIYFYQLVAGDYVQTKKMVLLK